MNEFEIAGRKVGEGYAPLVIAEIGINHEGSLETAMEMVDSAIHAGAEVIKHQTHIVEDEMSSEAQGIIPGNADVSIYEIMDRCALSEEDELALKNYVEGKGAIFISTPFSRAAAYRLEKFGVSAYKIGSGECNNYPLLELVASFGKPVILSTGMNTIQSINKAVEIFKKHNVSYALMHCTNLYPTDDRLVRLGALTQMKEAFPDVVIGLSDHTLDNIACLSAVALGADILERHYTDHKERPGPDIICSMDEMECNQLITQSARIAKMRGGNKEILSEEKVTSDFAYASVVSIKNIKVGEVFSENNIWVKRPGTGDFLAEDYQNILGKIARCNIDSNVQISRQDVEDL